MRGSSLASENRQPQNSDSGGAPDSNHDQDSDDSKKSGGEDDQGGDAAGMEVDQQNDQSVSVVVDKPDSNQQPQNRPQQSLGTGQNLDYVEPHGNTS